MRAIGYSRVSTDGQAESGLSLEAQRAKIQAYANLKDMELVEIVEDAGISAKNLNRPGIQKIMDMARRKEIDAVIILKMDRMFRNTVDALTTSQFFQKHNVALHSINENLDTQSAIGGFFFTLMAGLAEMERKMTAERTVTALKQKKARGEKTGGYVPFGYNCNENGNLSVNDDEQATIARITELRDKGFTYQQIAESLNSKGITTKTGKAWTKAHVFKIYKKAA